TLGEGGERRFRIIQRYYGLDGNLPSRLSAMGTKYGISRERVRQIKDRAIGMLRHTGVRRDLERTLIDTCRHLDCGPREAPPSNQEGTAFKLRSHRELLLIDDQMSVATAEQKVALR